MLSINPSPGGGLTQDTTLELRTLKTGLFSLVGVLEKTRERAVYMKRHSMDDEENLRTSSIYLSSAYESDQQLAYDSRLLVI